MQISIKGARTFTEDWQEAQRVPAGQLPPLTPEQAATAKQLRIPAEDYARTILAQRKSQDRWLAELEGTARVLARWVKERDSRASVELVALDQLQGKLEVAIELDGARRTMRMDETLLEDLFERGSLDAEQRIRRIIDLALERRVA